MSANDRKPEYIGVRNIYTELIPFALNYNDRIEFKVCKDEEVDESFKAMIKGKNLYYNLRGHYCMVIYTAGNKRYMNKASQFFMDALALQKYQERIFLSTLMRMCWKKIMLYTVMKDI